MSEATLAAETVEPEELAHHFTSIDQQNQTASIGIWAFLVQEVMFFGGLFTVYLVYRLLYPQAFLEGSYHLAEGWGLYLGTANTVVLIGSSLTMALAVRSAQLGRHKQIAVYIGATFVLACVFLAVKAYEYGHKYDDALIPGVRWAPTAGAEPHLNLFYGLYFIMTGMHAVHMLVGLLLMGFVATRALRGRYTPRNYIGVEILGLYWHFVDLVWIFLFPLLYLLNTTGLH
jgi:cytochrome c oxidase subunit 3